MLSPVFAEISPALLIAVALLVVVALGLLVAGIRSARNAAALRAPKPSEPPRPSPAALERTEPLRPSLQAPERVPVTPEPPKPWEAPGLGEAEVEALKKEAYRQKKQEEAAAKERRRAEEAAEAAEQAAREAAERAEVEASAAAARAAAATRAQAEAGKTLADGLARTRGGFMQRLNGLFGGPKEVDAQLLAQLEEVLFSADIGVRTATQLLEVARERLARGALSDPQAVKGAIRSEIERILDQAQAGATPAGAHKPEVWMVVGVNGAGKTTTIGKLAAQLTAEGKKVILGAGDTFRAAAAEQLAVWAQRSGAELVRGPEGSDPGSVAFEAVKRGKDSGADAVIIDTAGRLHTKAPLMEELKKVKRVIQKAEASAPHQVLLVLDSTNGQNAIAQARQFHEALQVTGVALTKLDGTAKGGVVIGISDELKLPLQFIGVGEAVGDLQRFEPHAFVEALFA